jgi:hypothetical protein
VGALAGCLWEEHEVCAFQVFWGKQPANKKVRTMKIINRVVLGIVVLFFASAIPAIAIEGLQISVQCSNVVLSWPSVEGETYIVQYRQSLNPTDSWATVTDYLPAATGANMTTFVHSNIVQNPSCGCDGGSSMAMASLRNSLALTVAEPVAPVPMAIPANGTGGAVPLALYPPGINLSGLIIFDPVTGESVDGAGYSIRALSLSSQRFGGFQPLDSGGSDSFMPEPETGFYQVVRNGVHIVGLTNGIVLSGEVQLPIELALDSTDEIVGVTFYDENNSPIIGASAHGSGNCWSLDWNTPMSANGNYNIYAEVDFASDDPVVSAPVTVTVNNIISFPNYFTRVFGSQMWIFAQTIPDAAYEIDMYDESTNYLGSFYDYADGGGYISFLWDLTDGNGHTFDSTNFFGLFTVDTSSLNTLSKAQANNLDASSPTSQSLSPLKKTFGSKVQTNRVQPADSSSSSSANQFWVRESPWSPGNGWAIAYSPLNASDPNSTFKISEMMIGGNGGELGGVVSALGNYGLGAQMSPGNVSQSSAFKMADTNSRAQFLSYLADFSYRHFYFFGHGSATSFGTRGAVITQDDVASTLHNFPLNWLLVPGAAHPYQFVFIDGCSAGSGNFCEAFGIPALTVNNQYFKFTHIQSRAFLGYKRTASFNPNQWDWRSIMLGGFFDDWQQGNLTIQQCVNNAVNGVHNGGMVTMDSSWVIYGATDLTRYTDTTQ